jgi:hypothetical protein
VTEPETSAPLLTPAEYELLLVEAKQVIELDATFPDWVFKRHGGSLRFTDRIDHGWFTLRDFAELHGDDSISLVVLDPIDHESITGPDLRMAFTLPTSSSRDEYYRALNFSPDQNLISDIQTLAARLAAFGPSKRWAFVSERDIGAWWSELPLDDPRLKEFERRRRPWAYTADEALGWWGMAFRGGVPEETSKRFQQNYERFDHPDDPEAGLPEWHSWDFKDDE